MTAARSSASLAGRGEHLGFVAAVAQSNIDRIAREGVRSTHAFAGAAMCSPIRQQMMTGIFPIRNGAEQLAAREVHRLIS